MGSAFGVAFSGVGSRFPGRWLGAIGKTLRRTATRGNRGKTPEFSPGSMGPRQVVGWGTRIRT